MSNKRKETPPMNWKALEDLVGQPLPFFQDGDQAKWLKDMTWVEDLVKNTLNQSMPKKASTAASHPNSEVFETHHNVIVRIPIPKSINPRALQVFVSTHQLKIEGWPNHQDHIVRFPSPILRSRSKVIYKAGILQVTAKKQMHNGKYKELFIEF
jgi:HSP20 family molecular chaperone IbpA